MWLEEAFQTCLQTESLLVFTDFIWQISNLFLYSNTMVISFNHVSGLYACHPCYNCKIDT